MGRWLKVTGNKRELKWARRVCNKHNALRTEFKGGFYASFSDNHIRPTIMGFRSWKLKVEKLDGPPSKLDSKGKKLVKSRVPPLGLEGRKTIPFHPKKRIKNKEETTHILGTTVADIRALAFDHTKGEVAFLLGVTTRELNEAFLKENIEPIYFGYKCRSCRLSFQGSDALRDFRSHVLTCR